MKNNIIIALALIALFSTFTNATELYKKCAGCHGENGELSALEKSTKIGGQEKNLTVKQLTAYKRGELDQYSLGNIMKLQLETLSEKDIEEVAEYISTLEDNTSK